MGVIKELCQEALPQLRDTLESQLPNSLAVYGFVDVMIRYDLNELGTKIFAATEVSLGTFVVLTPTSSWEGMQSVTLYYEDTDRPDGEDESTDEEFMKLLESVPGLDWGKAVHLYGCPSYVCKKIRRLMNSGKLMADPKYQIVCQTHAFVLTRNDDNYDRALQQEITVTEGYTLGNLTPAHTDWIYEHWPLNFSETRSSICTSLTRLPSVAAFKKDPGENGTKKPQPVSWIRMYPDGALGNTFTLPEHRRKGLARNVTLTLSKKLDAIGSPIFVYVEDENVYSAAFHMKIGFKKSCPFAWEVYRPSDDPWRSSVPLDTLTKGQKTVA